MITRIEFEQARQSGSRLIKKTGIHVAEIELDQIAVADFGLSDLKHFGAQILTLFNTEKIAAKLITMHPFQIMPEHWHPKIGEYEGKEETLRVEWGNMFFYAPGDPTSNPHAVIPEERKKFFTCWHETIMQPGDMQILPPKIPHWFQAGPHGVVVWSFSTKVLDLQDEFTDPSIIRETVIKQDD